MAAGPRRTRRADSAPRFAQRSGYRIQGMEDGKRAATGLSGNKKVQESLKKA